MLLRKRSDAGHVYTRGDIDGSSRHIKDGAVHIRHTHRVILSFIIE